MEKSVYLKPFADGEAVQFRHREGDVTRALQEAINSLKREKGYGIILSLIHIFSMEKSGEPPIPNKFAKAVMMVRMGKVMPTPVRASAPTPGICPRYIRSTTL